ncbi:hypothetical protein Ccr2_gp143c [Caulobacter phage Ccr2]|uniref:Uncharacterized protein n=3 Tax=Shapirovirus cbk TaxID=1204537 RepID=J3UID7_9CAUD|nr:hypothetical protein phiCbK_174 [Caulobacter phage phiCbK]ARB13673.1 hypothetical protein Ccr10_gp144c [Caulobacter phage Ccr10]ARB14018.1 hypothetical protein Ccr2_gp143c [Caulobacter phage Ccr2]ARB14706.1 hypothetical protein Ccr29_gp150 [Caulobacter phage Ccr29]ARB15061.1 hypothetical protein Ccr32_gp143 [Caulobacter phage Ccr32]ARB15395.1 hypothetical protein Ccr34_gp153 [Caulobacter phage Ccr34]
MTAPTPEQDPVETLSPEEKAAYLKAAREKYPPEAVEVLDQALASGKLTRQDLQTGIEMTYGREAMNRKARRRQQAGDKGRTKTASLDRLYGKLVAEGLVQIVRKRGKAPQIIWL